MKGYNWEDFFDRKEVRKYDLFSQYAMIAADQAMTDSGIDLEKVDKLRSGVIWASGIGGLRSMFDEIAGFLEGGQIPRFSPFFIPKMISDIAAGYISMKYGLWVPTSVRFRPARRPTMPSSWRPTRYAWGVPTS